MGHLSTQTVVHKKCTQVTLKPAPEGYIQITRQSMLKRLFYWCSTVVNCYLRTVNALKQNRAGVLTQYMQYTTGACQEQLPRNSSCFREEQTSPA